MAQEEGNIGNTEEQLNNTNSELPCLDSSSECISKLTNKAIAFSPKLKTLDNRIALIGVKLRKLPPSAKRLKLSQTGKLSIAFS